MEGVAKIFGAILLFIFAMGIFVALAPGYYSKMGERRTAPKIAELEDQNHRLQIEMTESGRREKEAQAYAQEQQELRRKAEQQTDIAARMVHKKDEEIRVMEQSLKDSSIQLASYREKLQDANEARQLAETRFEQEQLKVLALNDSLKAKDIAIVSRQEEIIKLTELVEKMKPAQRKVEIYQMLALMLLLVGIIFLTLRYWNQDKIAKTRKTPILRMKPSDVPRAAS